MNFGGKPEARVGREREMREIVYERRKVDGLWGVGKRENRAGDLSG